MYPRTAEGSGYHRVHMLRAIAELHQHCSLKNPPRPQPGYRSRWAETSVTDFQPGSIAPGPTRNQDEPAPSQLPDDWRPAPSASRMAWEPAPLHFAHGRRPDAVRMGWRARRL